MATLIRFLLVLICLQLAPAFAQDASAKGFGGQIRIVGSDSMDPLLRLWIYEFQKQQPSAKFEVTSHGSGTAPSALLKGESDLGPMSRPMNTAELEAFRAKLGREPLRLGVAHDALAIFVNRRNPLSNIRMDQLDGLYGETRLSGYQWPIRTWKAFGLRRSWARNPIRAFTRDEKSGSRALFLEKILKKGGKFRTEIQVADQMGIMAAVAKDVRALGYGPLSYAGPQVRMVPLSPAKGQPALLPTPESVRKGTYPLSRQLYVYLDPESLKEGTPKAQVLRAFLAFVLSPQGQALVIRDGAISLEPALARDQASELR